MRQAELNYLVLYCDDVAACRDFYTSLGMRFVREQHGESGPTHYAATLAGGVVFELYPAGEGNGVSATGRIRLGLTVPVGVRSPIDDRAGRHVVRDPEGRAVELTVVSG